MKHLTVKFLSRSITDRQTINRMGRCGGFWDKIIRLNGRIVSLEQIKQFIKSGERVLMGDKKNPKYVKCGLSYNDPWDGTIPYVIASNHPRFVPGKRFDYGFMCVALNDGYCISYNYE